MTRRRAIVLAAAALVAAAAVAVARLPPTQALAWAGLPAETATGTSGSAWSGRAQRVAFDGPAPLEDLRWDVAAWRLLTGRLAADATFRLAGLAVEGRFASAPGGRTSVHDATVDGPAAAIPWLMGVPYVGLGGELEATIDAAVLEQRRPRHLRARFRWRGASVRAPVRLDLGDVRGHVTPGADGGHTLRLEARGGEVAIDGDAELTGDRRYRLELVLTPAPDAPQRVHDILGLLGQARDGQYVIRRSGQLRP